MMKPLHLFNTLTRQKEVFTPLLPQHVGMYVCGPTVSGESHLGHARPYITFDILYRYLKHMGYHVRYVRNITDAGHFEEEGREAEDKVHTKAVLENIEPMELVQKYTRLFHWAMQQLNCVEPSIEPTATGHIVEQISMIEKIIAEGFAYHVNGSVYFDVVKYAAHHQYGILSNRKIEDMISNTRTLQAQEEKRNALDFALWKKAPEKHLMRWQSPWGEGFPGWHIECSAMSKKYLGEVFDIHGGGMDLQFPHHECEIAQSQIAHQHNPARYWIHNNMITINGKKMGKSYNNVIKLTELFAGTHPLISTPIAPQTVRFFILQTHYSSTLDFSQEALLASEKALQRLWQGYHNILHLKTDKMLNTPTQLDQELHTWLNKIEHDLADDLNTAKVLASFFEIIPITNSVYHQTLPNDALSAPFVATLKAFFKTYLEDILGIQGTADNQSQKLKSVMRLLLDIRTQAKQQKNYALSDMIRKALETDGITIKDNKDGTTEWA